MRMNEHVAPEIIKTVLGLAAFSGKYSDHYICLLEHFQNSDRVFLSSLTPLVSPAIQAGDPGLGLRQVLVQRHVTFCVTDFPVSPPPCVYCKLSCPGEAACNHPETVAMRTLVKNFSEEKNLPKTLRNRFKKPYYPFTHRATDVWAQRKYHLLLGKFFDQSYDVWGHVQIKSVLNFHYLRHFFPRDCVVKESFVPIILLELLAANVCRKRDLLMLKNKDHGSLEEARHHFSELIEKKFSIFIYNQDKELLAKSPSAFRAFLLALAARQAIKQRCEEQGSFIAPLFSD